MAKKSEGVKKSEKMWMDGKLVPWDEARLPFLTHTFHYGLGVFEGIRCYRQAAGGSAVFRLREHLRRLLQSAHICLMPVPFTESQLHQAVLESFKVNKMEEGYARPVAYLGDGAMGLGAVNPTRVAIAVWPWAAYLGEEGMKHGVRAKISSLRRMSLGSSMPRGKITGQYVNSILAQREAVLAGYDEAILLDDQGLVAEGSGENIFMVKDGVLYTPPLTSPILGGVTRDTVLALAAEEGIPFREQTFTRDALYVADEAFFTGTAVEVTPIREVDDRKIGDASPGQITQRIQEVFRKATRGQLPKRGEWLSRI